MNNPMSPPDSPQTQRLQRLRGFLLADPDNTQLLRDYAREAASAGDLQACLSATKQLTLSDAAEAADFALMGAALRATGRAQEALTALGDGFERWPDDAALAIERAKTLLVTSDFEGALAVLPEEIEDPGLAAEACAVQVKLHHHLGQLEEAVELGERFLRDRHNDPRVAANLIPVLLDTYRAEDALMLAQGLLSHGIDAYAAYEALATDALARHAPAEAAQWTAKALAKRQDDGRIWLLEGMARLRSGHAAQAVQALEQAVQLQPGHAGTHLALGWTHVMLQQLARAQACFEQAVQASPSFSEGHGSLAVVAALQGRQAEAKELVRKARRLDPACASILYAEAVLAGKDAAGMAELSNAFLAQLTPTNR
jgi:Flp pilus assembly protein TadD